MVSTTVIDQARDLIKTRLDQLEEERRRLEGALGELGGKASPTRPRGRRGRPRGAKSTAAPKRLRRRKGTRADEALAVVGRQPGISAAEVAKAMKIKPGSVYGVLGALRKEGKVKKDGRRYFPAAERH